MKTFKTFIENDETYSYTIHQHLKDGSTSKWGSGHSLETAKKEAIDSTEALGSKFGHEFSIRNKEGDTVHHFSYGKRRHNAGDYIWDKLDGKTHKDDI
jgi:hypothetical protein